MRRGVSVEVDICSHGPPLILQGCWRVAIGVIHAPFTLQTFLDHQPFRAHQQISQPKSLISKTAGATKVCFNFNSLEPASLDRTVDLRPAKRKTLLHSTPFCIRISAGSLRGVQSPRCSITIRGMPWWCKTKINWISEHLIKMWRVRDSILRGSRPWFPSRSFALFSLWGGQGFLAAPL